MTFVIKVRTLPGSPMICEYECPRCGRFERLVERDASGDPPSTVICEGIDGVSEDCQSTRDGGERETAVLVVSAPSIKFWSRDAVPIGRASKSDEWDPRALDTRPLAEGRMTQKEWRKWQTDLRRERRFQKRLKSGRRSKRIQVGGG